MRDYILTSLEKGFESIYASISAPYRYPYLSVFATSMKVSYTGQISYQIRFRPLHGLDLRLE